MSRLCTWLCAALALPAALSLLPAPVVQGRQNDKALPSDLALVPGDCVAFACLRPGELDPALKTAAILFAGSGLEEQQTRVPLEEVDRIVFLAYKEGDITIVRTTRPYDAKALLDGLR